LAEFKKNLKEDQPAFGYIRVVVGNDELVIILYTVYYKIFMVIVVSPREPSLSWSVGVEPRSR
jgi:hypothetical protein